jgi:hypothetical protein
VTPEAIAASTPTKTGRRGRPARYSAIAIKAGLMLRLGTVFRTRRSIW